MRDGFGADGDRLFRVFARWIEDALVCRTIEGADAGVHRVAAAAQGGHGRSGKSRGEGPLVTHAQLQCLSFLARRPLCSIGGLSKGLTISDPAATKLVDRLENKGLVCRRASRDDRRVIYVELSEVGATLVSKLERRRSGLLEYAVKDLSARKLEVLARLMEGLLLTALDSPETIAQVCLRCGDNHSARCVVNRAHIMITGDGISW